MYCMKCGCVLPDDAVFCHGCGIELRSFFKETEEENKAEPGLDSLEEEIRAYDRTQAMPQNAVFNNNSAFVPNPELSPKPVFAPIPSAVKESANVPAPETISEHTENQAKTPQKTKGMDSLAKRILTVFLLAVFLCVTIGMTIYGMAKCDYPDLRSHYSSFGNMFNAVFSSHSPLDSDEFLGFLWFLIGAGATILIFLGMLLAGIRNSIVNAVREGRK